MLFRWLIPWALLQAALGAAVLALLSKAGVGLLGAGLVVFALLGGYGVYVRRPLAQWIRILPAARDVRQVWAALSSIEALLALQGVMLATKQVGMSPEVCWLALSVLLSLWALIEWLRTFITMRQAALQSVLHVHDEERAHMNGLFTEVRAQRHDFLLHVGVLQGMIAADRWPEAAAYIDQLAGHVRMTNEHIRGEHSAIAALLDACHHEAHDQGLSLAYDLEAPFSTIPLPVVEAVRLLGNLLNNAREAAAASQAKQITLRTSVRNGLFLLQLQNSTPPITREVVDNLFRSFGLTTKGGEHRGLGTYVIHAIVKHHHGHLDFVYDGARFSIKIKLPIVHDEKETATV